MAFRRRLLLLSLLVVNHCDDAFLILPLVERQKLARLRQSQQATPDHGRDPLPSFGPAESKLLQLTQAHFISQALHCFVMLELPDLMFNEGSMTVESIAKYLQASENSVVDPSYLLRILRLLTTVDICYQEIRKNDGNQCQIYFGLTEMGALLATSPGQQSSSSTTTTSLAPFVRHWMEEPLWNAWLELPNMVKDSTIPAFDRGNAMVSAPDFYRQNEASAIHRNQVAKYVSTREIPAIVNEFDWGQFNNKTVVDIGGGYGDLMAAVVNKYPDINCICLDLPEVVNGIEAPPNVKLVPGDMFDPSTIPQCDVIVSKHVLCDWSDSDVVRVLQSCHSVLPADGQVIILDAVLLDGPEASNQWQIQTSLDVLLMLTGRHMDRSVSQWQNVAQAAGFTMDKDVQSCPSSPSLNITKFEKVSC